MNPITLDNITQTVINHGDEAKTNPRLYEIYTSLVTHLHTFVQEVNLTEQELQMGRDFFTRVARPSGDMPDGEITMLTDLLGISELVDLLHRTNQNTVTESTLEGPMYVPDAPPRQIGDRLGIDEGGDVLFMSGRILDVNGSPIANALIDVWQTNSKGFYDIQDPNQPKGNFRGCFKSNADGYYAFETVVPIGYDIPANGPCGEVLRLLGRHTHRPAHIHFKLSAAGFKVLTTQTYLNDDPYISSDTVFAVVPSTIITLQKHEAPDEMLARNQSKPFYTVEFDFVLSPVIEEIGAMENTASSLKTVV
ncbi:dioxygenase [Chlorogloeopsis fritschii PCC 9212]|uniref:6-chlorohydroxyquinol-1,2-dioxygenase n=1 Tax=Chlorogloeopsis fritschii PCC 6912 TaxID=211165 RepID=A0A433NDU5_CHLFR|nr:dioxygenase [Chlorogloeopsis fritschii]RUR80228.1 6-chlorohydroxyquinol-1,2-dioxygenase [Chlorogloeopsis fritschii PCC 6912]